MTYLSISLTLRHLLVEFQMDLFQLLDRRQPPPRAGHGLPEAWMAIFQCDVYIGARRGRLFHSI